MLLEVKDLGVQYGDKAPVVKNVNLQIDRGEILAIVGESGSGKTTVIRSIMGCLPASAHIASGSICLEGTNIGAMSQSSRRNWQGTKVTMIFQDTGNTMDPIQRVGKQFCEYLQAHQPYTKKEAEARALELLSLAALPNGEDIIKKYPFELSGGQKQRVGIAMAMAFNPCLLLADEPTAALDVTTQKQVVEQLLALRDKTSMAMIIVTHNIKVAAYMSDKMLVMKKGQVIESGTTKLVMAHPQEEYTNQLIAAVPRLGGSRYVEG